MFKPLPSSMRLSLRVLAHLLRYPDAELRAHLGELSDALQLEAAVSGHRLDELQALIRRLPRLAAGSRVLVTHPGQGALAAAVPVVASGGRVVLEHRRGRSVGAVPGLRRFRLLEAGDSALSFYTVESEELA